MADKKKTSGKGPDKSKKRRYVAPSFKSHGKLSSVAVAFKP